MSPIFSRGSKVTCYYNAKIKGMQLLYLMNEITYINIAINHLFALTRKGK